MRHEEKPNRDRPVLETKRLLLRRPTFEDTSSILANAGDWEVARRLSRVPHPYTEQDARDFLEKVVPNEWVWGITWRSSGELVGMVGLRPTTEADVAELGYYVARRHWRVGIATEAAIAVVEHGINTLGLRVITAGYLLDNPLSGRVLSKLGFVEIGRSRRQSLSLGASLISVEMRLEIAQPASVPLSM